MTEQLSTYTHTQYHKTLSIFFPIKKYLQIYLKCYIISIALYSSALTPFSVISILPLSPSSGFIPSDVVSSTVLKLPSGYSV